MTNPFDPYHKWLAIPPSERPINHYRLLGLPLFESDTDVIANAADRQMLHIKSLASGPNAKESQKILNELSAAKVCLMHPARRREYDTHLRRELGRHNGLNSGVRRSPVADRRDSSDAPLPVVQTSGLPSTVFAASDRVRSRTKSSRRSWGLLSGAIVIMATLFYFLRDQQSSTQLRTSYSHQQSRSTSNNGDGTSNRNAIVERSITPDAIDGTEPSEPILPPRQSNADVPENRAKGSLDDHFPRAPAATSGLLDFGNAMARRDLSSAGEVLANLRQSSHGVAARDDVDSLQTIYDQSLHFWRLVSLAMEELTPGTELLWNGQPLALVVEASADRFVFRVPGRTLSSEIERLGDSKVLVDAPARVVLSIASLAPESTQPEASFGFAVFAAFESSMNAEEVASYWDQALRTTHSDVFRSQVESAAQLIERVSGVPPIKSGVQIAATTDAQLRLMDDAGTYRSNANLPPGDHDNRTLTLDVQQSLSGVDDNVKLELLAVNPGRDEHSEVLLVSKGDNTWDITFGNQILGTLRVFGGELVLSRPRELSPDGEALLVSRILKISSNGWSEYARMSAPIAISPVPLDFSQPVTRVSLFESPQPSPSGLRLNVIRLEGCNNFITQKDGEHAIDVGRQIELEFMHVQDAGIEVSFDEYHAQLRVSLRPYFCLTGSKKRLPLTCENLDERTKGIRQTIEKNSAEIPRLESDVSQLTAARGRIAKQVIPAGPAASALAIQKARQLEAANRRLASTTRRIQSLTTATTKLRQEVDRLLMLAQALEEVGNRGMLLFEITHEVDADVQNGSVVIARTDMSQKQVLGSKKDDAPN